MSGLRILVTRPREQAPAWVQALQDGGFDAVALPLIEIGAAADVSAVHAAWERLAGMDFVMFVSANAVERFFAARSAGPVWPQGLRAGATGPGTASALAAVGLSPAQVIAPAPDAATFDAEALWQRIAAWPWQGRQVLVVRGQEGRDWLADRWRQQGASVQFVEAYRRHVPLWSDEEAACCTRALAAPERHWWLFTSSEAIGHLRTLRPHADWQASRALASHPRIAAAAERQGFGRVELTGPTLPAVLQRLRELSTPSVQSPPP